MLGERRVAELLKGALAQARIGEVEIVLLAGHEALTRFANNTIHQNVAETNGEAAVRLAVGKRLGSAITNRLDPEALAQAIAQAEASARRAPETPDFPGFPAPQPTEPVFAFDEAAAGATPEDRARLVGEVIRLAEEVGAVASGALSTAVEEVAVANSKGVFCYHAGTRVRFRTVVHREDGSGYAERAAWRWDALHVPSLARSAVDRALQAQHPREVPPGVYPVLLDPYAVQDMVSWLGYAGAGALAVQEGRSWMNDRIGTKVLSDLLTLWDDGRDPAGIPLPFDFEGVPRQRVVIVDRGVPRGPVYDTVTAARDGKPSTGHALPKAWPEAASLGPLPTHLFLAVGDATTEDLLRALGEGLYITRFWYTRLVHPRDCVVTGMTRDGVFWVEGGEIAYPVRNLRFTQGYVQALAGAKQVGNETYLLSNGRFGADRVPALLLESFTFTGVTEY